MNLLKEMPMVAARELKITRGSNPEWLKGRIALVAEAYGTAAVLADFTNWCRERAAGTEPVKYPVSEYLKAVDSRLGSADEEQKLDIKSPDVAELTSMTYELTGTLPSATSVAELLTFYPAQEVKAALVEFTEGLTERELKSSMKNFYSNSGAGAAAIILARRRREKQ
jgi:hypothetical protein